MPKRKHSTKVPPNMQPYYQAITTLTDKFCKQHLSDEYLQLIQFATAALARKRPSPLVSGKTNTWACGIVYAIGFANFLFDKSFEPFISASDLADYFNISKSTAGNKSKQIRGLLKIHQMDHFWCLPSRYETSAMSWMITVNGFIIDARTLPIEIQSEAYEKGLIPYIPALAE